jgi:heat shock protein HslJ
MRSTIFTIALLVIALIATACGGHNEPSGSNANTLDGTRWTLATLHGQTALKETTVTLNFAAGKVSGSDGCNNYADSYTADGNNIRINQPFAATMMACPEPIMEQATSYLQALDQAATYQADDRRMSLYDTGGRELATFSAQNRGLADTAWIATGYNNGRQATVSVMAGTELTANFGADGKLSGSAGCNSYATSYRIDEDKITIGSTVLTTRKACEQAVMDQEMQYLAALSTAAAYRIDGSKLELRNADGALAATFNTAGQ